MTMTIPIETTHPKAQEAADALQKKLGSGIDLFMVAGSGFRDALPVLENSKTISMLDVVHFPNPAVAGHGSQLIYGQLAGKKILIATGRVHLYEGRACDEIVFGVRMAAALGAKGVVLTNAAGSVDRKLPAGTLMAIKDQMNLTGQNCEAGAHNKTVIFTDMMNCYDKQWREKVMAQCNLPEGVYAGVTGPSYETMAEAKMLAVLGANVVGMSTVLECIAARTLGLRVLGLSFVTNMAGGLGGAILHSDVLEIAQKNKSILATALAAAITSF